MMKFVNRYLVAIMVLSPLSLARASTEWSKIVDCKNNEIVVDRGLDASNGETRYQVVFRDQETVGKFLESGVVNPRRLTSLSEIVLNLTPLREDSTSWVGEDDTRQLLGVVYYVRMSGSKLNFEAHRTTGQTTGEYTINESMGSWSFDQCARPFQDMLPSLFAHR